MGFISWGGGCGESGQRMTDDPGFGIEFCSIGKGVCSFSGGCHYRYGGVERNAIYGVSAG